LSCKPNCNCSACVSFKKARRKGRLLDANGRIRVGPPARKGAAWLPAAIALLAPRLAKRLARSDWKPLPPVEIGRDVTLQQLCKTRELITAAQWLELLGSISTGTHIPRALKQAGITPTVLHRYLNAAPQLAQQFSRAKTAGNRKNWPPYLIDRILASIATGMSMREACLTHGASPNCFRQLTTNDKPLEARYLAAVRIRSSRHFDSLWAEAGTIVNRKERYAVNSRSNRLLHMRPVRLQLRKRRRSEFSERLQASRQRAKQR
jgi:hypothetical protein